MAMLYTPQQMSGGPSFCKGVRVGNWSEDISLEEVRRRRRADAVEGRR